MSEYVNHYAYHYQSAWRERAHDTKAPNPLWFRIMCLAYGSHRRNGHASFGPGEIARQLGVESNRVSEAIAAAKARGLIDAKSNSRCLIVPAHAITHGPGVPTEPCGYCEGKRNGRRKPQIRRQSPTRPLTPAVAERPVETSSASNVMPLNPAPTTKPELDCVGCKTFTRDGCNVHGAHWQKLGEPVPA
ncbi:MAG: hypothetical protein JWR11_2619 [Mycobacterium sp.]|nr:hypothetical protein [Mycobacterium sp.]